MNNIGIRWLVCVCVSYLFFGLNVVSALSFPDVPSSHMHSVGIDYVSNQGIARGYTNGNFGPDDAMPRGELTTMLIRATYTAADIGNCTDYPFPDVGPDNKHAKAICIANREGILQGYSTGEYKPDRKISVGEGIKMTAGALGILIDPDATTFDPFMDALRERNAIPSDIVSEGDLLLRGQQATILYNLRDVLAEIGIVGGGGVDNATNDFTSEGIDVIGHGHEFYEGTSYVGIGGIPVEWSRDLKAFYARTWLCTPDYSLGYKVYDCGETSDGLLFTSTLVNNEGVARSDFFIPENGAPVLIEFHDQTSAIYGTCATRGVYDAETRKMWADCMTNGEAVWDDFIQTGKFDDIYGPLRSISAEEDRDRDGDRELYVSPGPSFV